MLDPTIFIRSLKGTLRYRVLFELGKALISLGRLASSQGTSSRINLFSP